MNSLEIVRLVRSKPASELAIEEVIQLRDAVASTPELLHLLGGEEEFERYLAEAPEVTGMLAEEPENGESREVAAGRFRRPFWIVACLVVFIAMVAGVWVFRVDRERGSSIDARLVGSNERGDGEGAISGAMESRRAEISGKDGGEADDDPSVRDPEPSEEPLVQPRLEPYALFEDDGRFAAVGEGVAGDGSVAVLTDDGPYSGQRSVRLIPGNGFRLVLDQPLQIWAHPAQGDYRYLRFAFRKFGGGRVCLALNDEGSAVSYDAGQGPPSQGSARRVWGLELPSEWIVMTRDVFADFGARDITSVTLRVPDGEYAQFDHIYLARTLDGFDGIADAPSMELTNQRARRVLAKDVLSIARPSVVRLEASGQRGTGVLIGKQGHVLTSGHLLLAMEDDITVHLADGRTFRGRKAGICRTADCGVIRIAESLNGLGLEFSDKDVHSPQDLHVGFSITDQVNDGKVAASYLVEPQAGGEGMLWANFEMKGAELGGPLVDREGRVVGIHVRTIAERKMGFGTLTEVRAEWERLTRDEIWGEWLPGTGPMIGVVSTAVEEGSRVDRFLPDSPAAKAGVEVGDVISKVEGHAVRSYLDIGRQIADCDPGDSIALQILRNGKPIDLRIRLMPRQEVRAP